MLKKEIFHAGEMWQFRGISNLHTFKGYMGRIYSARDIWAFFCGGCNLMQKSKQEDSRFNYHRIDEFILFVLHVKRMTRFFFITFILKKLFLLLICITNKYFLLQATTLGHEQRLIEVFVKTHKRNDDCQKEVQQLMDSRA